MKRFCFSLLLLSISFASVQAQVTGLGYTLTPKISTLRFDDQSGLSDGLMYGAKLGFSFGEYVELSGLYLFNSDLKTDFSRLSALNNVQVGLDPSLIERSITGSQLGGEFKVNLGRGSLFPFITAGTGLLRYEPDNLPQTESIYLQGGGGLQYSVASRYTLTLEVTSMMYRANAAALFSETDLNDLGVTRDAFQNERLSNIALSAGLQFYLGGRSRGELTEVDRAFQEQFSGGLRGVSLQVEPVGAQINFDENLGYRTDQRMAGVAVGVDFGPFVGLRGFYWRGLEDGPVSSMDDLQAYGGEIKLNFSSYTRSITPHVLFGGGFMDVLDGYAGNSTATPDDRAFMTVGGGISLPLGNAVHVNAGVRSLLMSTVSTDEVSQPDQVRSSLMYSAGISFGLGAQGTTGGTLIGREMEASRSATQREQDRLAFDLAQRERAVARAEARIDSLANALVAAQQGNTSALEAIRAEQRRTSMRRDSLARTAGNAAPGRGPTAGATMAATSTDTTPTHSSQAMAVSNPAAGTWVTLPVPQQGELYVRYGAPGGVSVESLTGDATTMLMDPVTGTLYPAANAGSAAGGLSAGEVQQVVQRALQQELSRTRTPGDSTRLAASDTALLLALERRLDERLSAMEAQLLQSANATPQQNTPVVIQQPDTDTPTVIVEEGNPQPAPGPGIRFVGLLPLTGFNLNAPYQGLIGIRADLRNPSMGNFRLYPELTLGLGQDGVSRRININAVYPLAFSFLEPYQPYAGTGIGFLSIEGLELVLNIVVGTERAFGPGVFFGEFMTQDFFDNNRLAFGYRFNF